MSPQIPPNVPSRAGDIIITCIVCPIIATIIVSIRVWTRVVVTRNLGWDDYAAMITLLFCISFSVVLGISTRFGMGLHSWDVRLNSESFFLSQCHFAVTGHASRAEYSLQHHSTP